MMLSFLLKIRTFCLSFVCLFFLVSSSWSWPVVDFSNLVPNTTKAVESVSQLGKKAKQLIQEARQIQVQIQQYENMVQNSMAPAAWIWGAGQNLHDQFKERLEKLRNFNPSEEFQRYSQQWGDINFYRNSPCYRLGGCSKKEEEERFHSRATLAQTQKEANEGLLKTLDSQAKELSQEAASLKQLQNKTENAEGELDAIGYSNQMEGQKANQLINLRELMITKQKVRATHLQTIADREAQETAASDYLRSGEFVKSEPVAW